MNPGKAGERDNMERKTQMIAAVCGIKNSGKTTLLTGLVKNLTDRGLKTAVIKHDGHDFTCDIEGTDSCRMKEAGAYGTAVFSRHRMFVHKTGTGETEEALIGMFPEADVILLEGMKDSEYPKIEVIRKEISKMPVSNPKGRFLIVTDWESENYDEPVMRFEQIDAIADCLLEQLQNRIKNY